MNADVRKLVGGALVLVLVMAAGSARASEDGGDGSDMGEPGAIALDDAIETLEPAAREAWPQEFAGLWIEETDEGLVQSVSIAFTGGAEQKVATLAEDFPQPELLQAVSFERSMAELESRQNEMIADRELAREGDFELPGVPGAAYNLDIDVERNALVATVEEVSLEVVAAFKEEYGDDVIVEQGELGEPKCVRSNCPPNLRAGLRTNLEGGGYCTMAFTVRVTSTGNRNILSAGHCGPVDQIHRHPGVRFGVVRARQYNGRVDAMRIGPPEDGFFMVPRIFVKEANPWVPVYYRSSWEGLVTHADACKSGATTGSSCGEIQSKHFSPSWVPNANRFVRVQNCAMGGDSGSALFHEDHWNKVHGILSGGLPTDCPNPDQWNAYGHIEYALNALGVTLETL